MVEEPVPDPIPQNRKVTPIQSSSRPASKGEVRFHTASTPTNKSGTLDKLSVSIARPSRETNEMIMLPDIEQYSMPSESQSPDQKRLSPTKRLDSRQGLGSRGAPNLPSITDEFVVGSHDAGVDLEDSLEGTGNLITKGGVEYLSSSAKKSNVKVFDMTGLDTRENTAILRNEHQTFQGDLNVLLKQMAKSKGDVGFENTVVSPIATPYIFSRPQTTRTARKMSEMERLMKVMKGQIHVKVKPKSRLQKIYIHSCGPGQQPYSFLRIN